MAAAALSAQPPPHPLRMAWSMTRDMPSGRAALPTQIPPSRKDILVAIRNELYQRDVVQKNLSKNLGKIFIWSSVSMGCREMTGLNAGTGNNIVGYNPWGDFRLTSEEMKAFWNVK